MLCSIKKKQSYTASLIVQQSQRATNVAVMSLPARVLMLKPAGTKAKLELHLKIWTQVILLSLNYSPYLFASEPTPLVQPYTGRSTVTLTPHIKGHFRPPFTTRLFLHLGRDIEGPVARPPIAYTHLIHLHTKRQ